MIKPSRFSYTCTLVLFSSFELEFLVLFFPFIVRILRPDIRNTLFTKMIKC